MMQKMIKKTDFLYMKPTLIPTQVVINAKMLIGTAPKVSVFISAVVHYTFYIGYCGKWEESAHCSF
jgi:hypothetical protein